jgi:uncharacterized protein (TIGR03435 family)
MTRVALATALAAALIFLPAGPPVHAAGLGQNTAAALEFDVASIKRNTTNTFASGPPPSPASGQFAMNNAPVQALILRGYPVETVPVQVIGLPDWAQSDRYDVLAKGKPNATPDEQRQMWKAFLLERLKLQVHYETRERPGYNLVFARADKRLGPQLRPATLDCSKPPEPLAASGPMDEKRIEAMGMSRCGVLTMSSATSQRVMSGSSPIATVVRMLSTSAERPVLDRTGLEGSYAISLTFARTSALPLSGGGGAPPAQSDEAPSLFTAVQEQLGLKLESVTVQGQALVVDHLERPTAD